MLVSGVQQTESVTHISILFHFIFWPRPSVHGGYPSFPCCVACGIYLSSQTRDQTHISYTGSLNHWTTSKVPIHSFFSSFPRGLYRLLSRIPCAIQEIIFSYDFGSFGLPLWEDSLEKGNATHSSILAWRIPGTLWSMGSQRVRHNWATFTFFGSFTNSFGSSVSAQFTQ